MYEFKIALRYLVPRKKSLSTALISLLSVFVISLVVWLVLVFLSVISGIEKNWLHKMTSLHAPIRIAPTEKYYNSYFYQVDSLSAASNYTIKTIGEKAESPFSNPYSEESDREIPFYWPKADLRDDQTFIDPVKSAYNQLASLQKQIPPLAFQDYEMEGALLRLGIEKPDGISYLSQMTYLLSIAERNPRLESLILPPASIDSVLEENDITPVLLPKNYLDAGVSIGCRGALSYVAPTAASSQEQRIPIRVAGFYDPGIMAVGSKCLLVPSSVTRTLHAVSQTFSPDGTPTNGIFVWLDNLADAPVVAKQIEEKFQEAGIASFWEVTTYEDYEFAKDLMQQFQSDRTLFLLVAIIILIVACANIISLLVLLVNDKKREIGILQAMGASFKSIAAIFGLCGILMGAFSSFIGAAAAIYTLKHLDSLVAFLSALQGRAAFNPAFFGQALPNELSYEALLFVLIATPLLSLAAGLIPAIKASRIRPASVLRPE